MSIRALVGNYLNGRALDTFIVWYKVYRKDLIEQGFNKRIPDFDERNIQNSITKFMIENGGRLIMNHNDLAFNLEILKPNRSSWLNYVKTFNEKFNNWNPMIFDDFDIEIKTTSQEEIIKTSKEFDIENQNRTDEMLAEHNEKYKRFFQRSEDKFSCYEIHRANMPANGCSKQCDGCKRIENERK